jgi:hypothetical protein
MTDAQLYQAAKGKGKITWYTSMPQNDLPAVTSAFEIAYPGISVSAL